MLSFTPHEYEAPIPESLTRGGLIGVRGFPDGKPLSPRSLPRVRLPGLIFQYYIYIYMCVEHNDNLKFRNHAILKLWKRDNLNKWNIEILKTNITKFWKVNPGSLTRGRLLGERGFLSGNPLTPMSPPRVRLSGIGASYSWGVNDNI